jgi:hypothetical protein
MGIEMFSVSQSNKLRECILNNLGELFGNTTVLLYGQTVGSKLARQYFIDSGASRVLNLPLPEKRTNCITDLFQIQNDGLLNPSKETLRYLYGVDPQREAKVYAGSSVSAETIDGRRVLGRRSLTWREVEKKKYQVELTQGQDGYNPYYIDFLNGFQLDDLLKYCIQNRPCILSGDTKGCIAMGSDYVYILHPDTPFEMIKKICETLYKTCDGVRVAPFSEGMPATYYGFVFNEQYVLYGPVEALVGFRSLDYKVVASGILIPVVLPNELIKKAREDVLTVLKRLVDRTGYKGAFGVDGCFKQNYFVVHEINTRICAGFSLISKVYHNLIPFGIIDMIIREGKPDKYRLLLTILKDDAEKVCHSVDLKLWEDRKLENTLRNKIPQSGDVTDLDKWKILVRNKTLSNCTPFYDFI